MLKNSPKENKCIMGLQILLGGKHARVLLEIFDISPVSLGYLYFLGLTGEINTPRFMILGK
jgi:hypothetical protein